MSETSEVRRITRGFQVTLPKGFRERHGLKVGDIVEMVEVGDELRVQLVEVTRKRMRAQLDEVLGRADEERDPSLSVATENEAMEVADTEIRNQRRARGR